MSPLSRLILFLSIGLVVGVAGLWISGGKKEEYSAKIEIDRRPSQIFPYLVEPEMLKSWMTGLEQIDKPVPPVDDYTEPPDLLRTVVSPNGKKVEYKDFVIRFTPDEILTVQSSASGTVHTTILKLESLDPGAAKFTYSVKVSHSSLSRLMAPLQNSKLQDRVNADVRKLKDLVEKNEPLLPPEAVPVELPAENKKTEQTSEEPSEEPSRPIDSAVPDFSGDDEGDQN